MNEKSVWVHETAWWDEEKVTIQFGKVVATWERHYVQQPVQRDFVARGRMRKD